MASITARPPSPTASASALDDPLDPRAQRGLDQALRLAIGALRVPLAIAALHGHDRSVRLIRLAESGVWDSIEGTGIPQTLADQVIGAVNAGNGARGIARGRISIGQVGVIEYSALPIQIGEERVGAFAVVDRRQREWGAEHQAMMRDIVGVIAGEVEWHRARLAASEIGGADQLIASLLEVSGEGIVVFDTGRRCRIWNPFLERLTGRTAQEIIGTSTDSVESLLGVRHLDLLVTRALMGESTTTKDQLFRPGTADSDAVYIAARVAPLKPANGPITGVVVVVTDTTPAVVAERRRKRGEELFRRLIEHSTELLTIVAPDGTILFDSLSNERIAGYEADELIGHRLFELVHRDDHAKVLAALDRVGAGTSGDSVTVEYRYRHKSGAWLQLLSVCRNLSDDPFVRGIVLNSRDISEWRAMEEQLHEARKMDALGRLAGGIAHDFNNLLTAIKGNVQLLLMDSPADAPGREELEEINRVSDRAAELTRRLLAFSRRQAPEPVFVDLAEVVRGTSRMLQRLVGDIRLSVTCEDRSFVRADPTQLEQVLLNLVINARDAMPNGGRVDVTVGPAPLPPDLAIAQPNAARRSYVRLSVKDTGQGMDPATQRQIFEPFFTTKDTGHGTGLGLATVYGIVRQSGGQIGVQSAVGKGTRFDVYLPLASPDDK